MGIVALSMGLVTLLKRVAEQFERRFGMGTVILAVAAGYAFVKFERIPGFLLVFTLTSKPFLRSLPVGINAFAGALVVDYGLRFAALSVGTAPMIIFYLLFRKQIEKGFAGAAVKE
jgi:ABC-type maltose transport system permease subunit